VTELAPRCNDIFTHSNNSNSWKKDIVGIQADKRKKEEEEEEEKEEAPSSPFLKKHLVKTKFWHHIPHPFFLHLEGKRSSILKRPYHCNSPLVADQFPYYSHTFFLGSLPY
jgi:hypothetical protein